MRNVSRFFRILVPLFFLAPGYVWAICPGPAIADFGIVARLPFDGPYTVTQGNCTGDHVDALAGGVDFGMDNTDVVAMADGDVWYVEPVGSGRCTPSGLLCPGCSVPNGIHVIVRHRNAQPDRLFSWYMHLSRVDSAIVPGAHVQMGQKLGVSGNTGCSTGPHLHVQFGRVRDTETIENYDWSPQGWSPHGTYDAVYPYPMQGDEVDSNGNKVGSGTGIVWFDDTGASHRYRYRGGPPGASRIVVSDGPGTSIAGASIQLRTANSTVAFLNSGVDGAWSIPELRPGAFDATVQKTGFRILHFTLFINVPSQLQQKDRVVAAQTTESNQDGLVPQNDASPSSRFQYGDRVQVTNTGVGLRARYPLYDSPPLAVMPDGDQGHIVLGPVSYNGYQWWLVGYNQLAPTLTWSAEGEPSTAVYYLSKISSAQPILNVSPGNQSAGAGPGLADFGVSNSGTGILSWSAVSNDGWLHVVSGATGTNSGTIHCSCDANQGSTQRTGTIHVTAPGAAGNPKNVTVTQAGLVTPPPQRPDIAVTYQSLNGPEIVIGDFTPSPTDGTDFGDIPISDDLSPAARVFLIQNYGNGTLQFTGSPIVQVSGSADFSISSQPPVTSLPPWVPGNTPRTGFWVQFDPHAPAGVKTAIISIPSNDSNHSPYQFAMQGNGVLPVLLVNAEGATDVPITVSPSDADGQTNGITPFSLYYSGGTQVALTAPSTMGASLFTEWSGTLNSQSGTTVYATLTDILSDKWVTAHYSSPARALTIQSTGATTVLIGVDPVDRDGDSSGTTNFVRSYDNGTYVALTATSLSHGKVFEGWSGVDGQVGDVGYVTMNDNKIAIASYVAIPADLDGDGYVDTTDWMAFVACVLGPADPQDDPACQKADVNEDGHTAMDDFAVLQRCWSGTMVGDPNCAR